MTPPSVPGTPPVPAAPALRRDAELNRQRILAAAHDVFAARGLGAALDDVAAAAGLGVGTVYRRFPDKDALVDALFEQSVRAVVGLLDTALADPDPWAGLSGYLHAACAQMAGDRGLRETLLSPRQGCPGVQVAREELVPRLSALVTRAQESGQLRPDVAATDVPVVLHAVQAAADLGAAAAPERDDHWRRLLTVVLDGWRADGACTRLDPAPLTDEQLHLAMVGDPAHPQPAAPVRSRPSSSS